MSKLKYNPISGNFDFVGGGAVLDYPVGSVQTFLQSNYHSLTNVALVANVLRGYYIYLEKDVSVSDLVAYIVTGVAGNSVWGLYNLDASGAPDSLLFQSAAFDNSVTGSQLDTVTQTITAGHYVIAYNSSSAATLRGTIFQSYYNTALGTGNNMLSQNGITVNYVYTGTLPATFPGGYTILTSTNMPLLGFTIQ